MLQHRLLVGLGRGAPQDAVENEGVEQEENGQIARDRGWARGVRDGRHGVARTGCPDSGRLPTCQRLRASAANIRIPPASQTETTVRDNMAAYQLGSMGDHARTGTQTSTKPARM